MAIESLGAQQSATQAQVNFATSAVKESAEEEQEIARLLEEAVEPTSRPDPSGGRGSLVDISA